MSPSDSDDHSEDEHESSDRVTDDDSRRQETGVRLKIGLQPVTDLLKGLVDVDVSRPPGDSNDERVTDDSRRRNHISTLRRSRPSKERGNEAESKSDSYYVDTYRSDDIVTVVADLPNVDVDDLTIGLANDSNALIIAVHGTVVKRVSLPWKHAVVDRAWFNNGVLEVRLHQADNADGSSED